MSQNLGIAGFELPHIGEEDKIDRVLSSALETRLGDRILRGSEEIGDRYWDAEYFGLNKVKVFRESSEEEQAAIAFICSYGLLEEAYFVEKAGVGYMAKMVMLAETTEERMLYGLFAADEATHLAQISRFLPQKQAIATDDAFLCFLADLVETKDKSVLLFVLQVVLEGWGLSHYRAIAQDCLHSGLAKIFQSFLQDEARHHSTGVMLFDRRSLSVSSQAAIVEALTLFLRMVQLGPQRVVGAIAQVKGHLSRQQKVRIFEELNTETHSGTRLAKLRSLMRSDAASNLLQELEERGAFVPFSAEQCVCFNL